MSKKLGDIFLVILGSAIMGFGIDLIIKSNLGMDSLSLFNTGVAKQLGISFGNASQLLMISILVVLFLVDRKRVGLGSVINGLLVGAFADLFMPFVSRFNGNSFFQSFLLFVGLLLMGIGIGTYVAAHLGEAGIDALMVFISEKFHKNIQKTRIVLDILLAGVGFLLGGTVGIGTLVAMFMNGPIIQLTINTIDKFRIKQTV